MSTPGRTEGRTPKHIEKWTIARLTSTLASSGLLVFPLSVTHRERPDFLLQFGTVKIGVEITEAITEEFASYCAFRERKYPEGIIDPGFFRPGTPRRTPDEMRDLPRDRLESEGWGDDGPEQDWALHVQKALDMKLAKLAHPGFEKFDRNWLAIYFNMVLPSVDLTKAIEFLQASVKDRWSRKPGFDVLFVEHHDVIARITANGFKLMPLNDLWK